MTGIQVKEQSSVCVFMHVYNCVHMHTSVLYGVLEKRVEIEEGKLLNRPESRKGPEKSRKQERNCELLRHHGANLS